MAGVFLRTWLAVVAIVTLALACGGGREAAPEGRASLIGRWEGRWEGTTGVPGCSSDRLVMEIYRQDGPRFEARVEGGCGGSFLASGEVSGTTLKLEGAAASGSISYRGSLQGGGKRMSGEWQVTVSPDYKGTWRLEKVSEQVSAPASPTPTATRPPSPTPPAPPSTPGDALASVPLPSGATLESSLRISGPPPVPVPMPPGAFSQWEVRTYRVAQSARQVAQFYRDRMPQEQWSMPFSVETETPSFQASMVFQRMEEGRQIAVIVSVEDSDGGAKLAVFRGS